MALPGLLIPLQRQVHPTVLTALLGSQVHEMRMPMNLQPRMNFALGFAMTEGKTTRAQLVLLDP
jgi:hypothetical protein